MINAVNYDKPLILIKAVSDTVLDMINAVNYDKPLISIRVKFQKKLASHYQAVK